jgi:hypothetical protein
MQEHKHPIHVRVPTTLVAIFREALYKGYITETEKTSAQIHNIKFYKYFCKYILKYIMQIKLFVIILSELRVFDVGNAYCVAILKWKKCDF